MIKKILAFVLSVAITASALWLVFGPYFKPWGKLEMSGVVLARAAAQQGRVDVVRDILSLTESEFYRDKVRAELAVALYVSGDVQGARAQIEKVPSELDYFLSRSVIFDIANDKNPSAADFEAKYRLRIFAIKDPLYAAESFFALALRLPEPSAKWRKHEVDKMLAACPDGLYKSRRRLACARLALGASDVKSFCNFISDTPLNFYSHADFYRAMKDDRFLNAYKSLKLSKSDGLMYVSWRVLSALATTKKNDDVLMRKILLYLPCSYGVTWRNTDLNRFITYAMAYTYWRVDEEKSDAYADLSASSQMIKDNMGFIDCYVLQAASMMAVMDKPKHSMVLLNSLRPLWRRIENIVPIFMCISPSDDSIDEFLATFKLLHKQKRSILPNLI